MAGRGQIAESMLAQLGGGLPTGPGTGLSQQQFNDRYAPELFNDYGSGSFPSAAGRGQYQNNDPSNSFNDRFTNSLQGGPGADNLYNYLYGSTGRNFAEGDTIPQQNGPNIPGDDWQYPLAQPQDPTRLGGGRNSIFAPNSLYRSPDDPMAPPDLFGIADQEMRDYTPFGPLQRGDQQDVPQSTPQGRIDDSYFNYIGDQQPQQQQQQDTPWWQQYMSPYQDQYYTSQMPQGRGGNTSFSDRFSNMPPNVELPPIGENDPSLIYGQGGRGNSLGPTQQTPWDSPQYPSGDTNQPQDYSGGYDVPLPQPRPEDQFRFAAPPSSYPTVSMPTPTPNQFGTTPTQSYFPELPTFTGNIGPSGYSPSDAAFSGMYTTHAVPDKDIDARRANLAYMKNALSLGRGY